MSIEDEIIDRVDRGMLFPLVPKAAGATIRRAMFVGEDLWGALTSPAGDDDWEVRVGRLRADLEFFVTEPAITPKYLFLLYPIVQAVWRLEAFAMTPRSEFWAGFRQKTSLYRPTTQSAKTSESGKIGHGRM